MLFPYAIGVATAGAMWVRWFDPWYETIALPSWSPSRETVRWGWLVGLASTLAGTALIASQSSRLVGLAGSLLWAQLATGLGWAAVFHLRRRARTGFYVICLHWSAVALAAAAVVALDLAAGVLMLPWLVFVTYLGAFNFFVWQLEDQR